MEKYISLDKENDQFVASEEIPWNTVEKITFVLRDRTVLIKIKNCYEEIDCKVRSNEAFENLMTQARLQLDLNQIFTDFSL